MCTLKTFRNVTVLVIAFKMGLIHAAPGSARLQFSQQNAIQLNEISVVQESQDLSLVFPQLISDVGFSAILTNAKQDLSNRILTYKNGETVPLANLDDGQRAIANVAVNGSHGNHSGSVGIVQDVKPSLFASKSLIAGYVFQLYQGATQLSMQFVISEDNQPFSYFIDPGTLESKPRATKVLGRHAAAGVEQIWTERFKTLFSIGYKNTELYRPDEVQIKLASGYVLNRDFTFKTEIGFVDENRSQKLTFDRGYFQSRWIDAELSYEWALDSFLISGLSFLDETEADPRRNSKTALGTDEFALGLKQTIRQFNYDLKAQYTFNSEKQSSTSFGGGVEWSF